MADSPKVYKAFSLTRTIRPRECEVSRYRHGCDPPKSHEISRHLQRSACYPQFYPAEKLPSHCSPRCDCRPRFSFHENWK